MRPTFSTSKSASHGTISGRRKVWRRVTGMLEKKGLAFAYFSTILAKGEAIGVIP